MNDLIRKANEDFKLLTQEERQIIHNMGPSKDMVLGEDYLITLSGQFMLSLIHI